MIARQVWKRTWICQGARACDGADSCCICNKQLRSSLLMMVVSLGMCLSLSTGQLKALTVEGVWNTHASMPSGKIQHSTAAIGSNLYVVGGATLGGPSATLDIYNSVTNTWASGSSLSVTQSLGTAVSINGMMYYAGGCQFADCTNTPQVLDTLQRYNPNTNSWSALTSAPSKHGGSPVSAVIGGKMYLVGGISTGFGSGGTPNPALEIYDPNTDSWSTGTNIPIPVEGGVAGTVNGKLYIAGGYDRGNSMVIDTLQIYDPGSGIWTTGASLPQVTQFATGGVINGIFYVIGGNDGSSTLDDLFAYDPLTNSWDSGPLMPTARHTYSSAVIGGSLYAVGGNDGSLRNALESFTPPAPIPEPNTFTMLVLVLAGIVRIRKRR